MNYIYEDFTNKEENQQKLKLNNDKILKFKDKNNPNSEDLAYLTYSQKDKTFRFSIVQDGILITKDVEPIFIK